MPHSITDESGNKLVLNSDGSLNVKGGATTPADSLVVPTTAIPSASLNELYNGATFDLQRGNLDNISVLASAARTATATQADQTNYNHRGIMVVVDVTAVAGSGIFTFEIDAKDPVSGKYVALLTSANVVGVSTNIYTVYPGNTVAANISASTVLPRTWRIKANYISGTSLTFSVGAMLIV